MSATARVGENFQQKIVRVSETRGSRSLLIAFYKKKAPTLEAKGQDRLGRNK